MDREHLRMLPFAVASLRTVMLGAAAGAAYAICDWDGWCCRRCYCHRRATAALHINDILFVSQVNRIRLCCPRELCYIFASRVFHIDSADRWPLLAVHTLASGGGTLKMPRIS